MTVAQVGRESVESMAKGNFAAVVSHFDATMGTALPEAKLREAWEAIVVQAGRFKSIAGTRSDKTQGYDIVFVTCEFEKSRLDAKFVFNSAGEISGLFFVPAPEPAAAHAPSYVESDAFSEREVTVGKGEWKLPGTLSMPKVGGPFPAVVLVHGSGPNNRDEAVGTNKPFKDIAQGLASSGIAVLRYDKRTMVHGDKLAKSALKLTVKDEAIDDALAAVSLLRETHGIDPNRICVLGHSLGGMLAPRIGKADSQIAGLIIVAGTTRSLGEVVIEQMNYLFGLDGLVSDEEKKQLEAIRQEVAKIDDPALSAESSASILGAPASYWLDLRGYKPAEVAKTLKQPMLIIHGGRDYQVTNADYENWKTALATRKDVTFKLYHHLNHLLITGEGKSTPAEYEVAGHVDELVITDIAKWIKARGK